MGVGGVSNTNVPPLYNAGGSGKIGENPFCTLIFAELEVEVDIFWAGVFICVGEFKLRALDEDDG